MSADGFLDDGAALRYEIGSIDAATSQRRPAATGQSPSAEVMGLPVGVSGVYICVRDDAGSELCQTEFVTVSEPPADFNPVDALSSALLIDSPSQASADQLAGTSQLFAALVNMAVGGSQGGAPAEGDGGEDEVVPVELPPEVQQVIAAQAQALIGGLVSAVNVEDNDAAQQVLSSVATVATATPAGLLSEEAKTQLLDVVQMGERPHPAALAAAAAAAAAARGWAC